MQFRVMDDHASIGGKVNRFGEKRLVDNIIAEHIEMTPGTCDGKPRIAGHRIRVQDVVVWHERMGLSPDEIVLHYPVITLADVYAALTYYHDHMSEIRQQIQADEAFAIEVQRQISSQVQQKLRSLNAESDSISSG